MSERVPPVLDLRRGLVQFRARPVLLREEAGQREDQQQPERNRDHEFDQRKACRRPAATGCLQQVVGLLMVGAGPSIEVGKAQRDTDDPTQLFIAVQVLAAVQRRIGSLGGRHALPCNAHGVGPGRRNRRASRSRALRPSRPRCRPPFRAAPASRLLHSVMSWTARVLAVADPTPQDQGWRSAPTPRYGVPALGSVVIA